MNDHAPRRRAEDQSDGQVTTEIDRRYQPGPKGRRRTRSRDFFQRFRQPLIGLGLAGAATPLIRAGQHETPNETPEDAQASALSTVPAHPADLEEDIAARLGEKRVEAEDAAAKIALAAANSAEAARETAVTAAMDRYNIERDLSELIYDNAIEANIDPAMAYGLVKTESSFKNTAKSHVGALGLAQVMPRTAKWLRPGIKTQDLYDRHTNLNLGFKYLRQLIDKYDGDVKLGLLAYNRGPGTVDKVLRRGGNPDNGYARKVLDG